MTKTFTTSASVRDAAVTVFAGEDAKGLLRAISSNSATSFVRENSNGSVSVPTRCVDAIVTHLTRRGWAAA